jgi:hypothetical protein
MVSADLLPWIDGWSEFNGYNRSYPLLIGATPRSGTQFLWREMRARGMDLGHEIFRPDGLISSIHVGTGVVDGRICAGNQTRYSLVIHQVRQPRLTICSLCTFGEHGLTYLSGNVERDLGPVPSNDVPLYDPTRVRFSMLVWLEWNRKIEADFQVDARFRVEDLSSQPAWGNLCDVVGLPPSDPPEAGDFNTNRKLFNEYLPWDQMAAADCRVAEEVQEMARRYGYDVD